MNEAKIKACPLCGAEISATCSQTTPRGVWHYVWCYKCFLTGPNHLTVAEAITHWNKRAGVSSQEQPELPSVITSAPCGGSVAAESVKNYACLDCCLEIKPLRKDGRLACADCGSKRLEPLEQKLPPNDKLSDREL